MKFSLDKIGTAGVFITALATPCCFPLFGFVLTSFGFGSAELFGGWTMWIFEALVLMSLVGLFFSYRLHGSIYPLLIAIPSAAVIVYAYNFYDNESWATFIYLGMFGLAAATGVNFYQNKLHGKCETCTIIDGNKVELESTITCPHCGYKKKEIMPTDACQFFYECEKCKTILKPNKGDCCVYCTYGTVKCPSIQAEKACC